MSSSYYVTTRKEWRHAIFDGNELNIKYHLHSTLIKLFTVGSLTYVTYEATQNKYFKESYKYIMDSS